MSDSFIDRVFANWSVDGRSPVTRSLAGTQTSGFIGDDAAHWSIESFIPMQTASLVDYLLSRPEVTPQTESKLRDCLRDLENHLSVRTGSYHSEFTRLYGGLDPDNDSSLPDAEQVQEAEEGLERDPEVEFPAEGVAEIVSLCEKVLEKAGYRRLEQKDIEACVGVASQWGVPLHVDFDMFEELLVFVRGDVMGTKLRRRLRRLYRPERVSVPIYQRMFVLFRLNTKDDTHEELVASAVHLRMFKNIPKQDVDMLLPGARVRISKMDSVKIIVPSLGGLVMSVRKIAQFMIIFAALTLYSTAIFVGLVLAALGYIVKSVLSYFQTKNRYLLNLTRNLYFQKLDTNAGAAHRLIRQSHRQSFNEAFLVYYALVTSDGPISTRRLRRRCERIVREAIQVEVDFCVRRGLETLQQLGKADRSADESWLLTEAQTH